MTARRFFLFALVLPLAVFCPGCLCAPDRWTVEEKTASDSRGRWSAGEVDISLSGPIPPLHHE